MGINKDSSNHKEFKKTTASSATPTPQATTQIVNTTGVVYLSSPNGNVWQLTIDDEGNVNSRNMTALESPTNFVPDVISATEISLAWYPVEGADSYIIEKSANAAFTSPVEIYHGVNDEFTATGLTTATKYYFRVKALGVERIDGPWATPISATTL